MDTWIRYFPLNESFIAERQEETRHEPSSESVMGAISRRDWFRGVCSAVLSGYSLTAVAQNPILSDAPFERNERGRTAEEISELLKPVWREQTAELDRRRIAVNERHNAIRSKLTDLKMDPTLLLFEGEWTEVMKQYGTLQGIVTTHIDDYHPKLLNVEKLLRRWEKWKTLGMENADPDPGFHARYSQIEANRIELEQRHKIALMTLPGGKRIGLYREERQKKPTLKHKEYLDRLASALRTPENLAMFLRYFMEFTHDSPNPIVDPWEKGTQENYGEFWQMPEETLLRTENGKMLGDCEDWAMLTHEILTRWGKKPFILHVPKHCTTVWLEKNRHGKYDGWSVCTQGLGKNLWRYGVAKNGIENGVVYNGTAEHAEGLATPELALNSVLQKFRESPVFDFSKWNMDKEIEIMKKWWQQKRISNETVQNPWDTLPINRLKEFVTLSDSVPLPPPELAMP